MHADAVSAPSEPPALPIAAGQIIAERYLVGEVLGGGGMGVVCAGTHVLLGTPVAIKLIHSDLKDNAEMVGRFVNEARAAAALKGEHIARVFDAGQLETGEPYLVMEQLEGQSLDLYLQERGALSQAEAVAIVLQVCEGLAEAHASALVHRDIKPANLFLATRPDGHYTVKIIDFGIAKQLVRADTPALTNPGKSLGSPWYMSPEQMLTPASVDERADIWSIGVMLFELLTDRLPFDGETVPQVCATVLATPPPRPSELRSDIPPELEDIVLRCLEKDPEHRFRSVIELAQALRPFAGASAQASEESALDLASVRLDPLPVLDPVPVLETRPARMYDSVTPLHSARDLRPARAEGRHWPIVLMLVAIASLGFGGYLQYRDPTLVRRAVGATHVKLPWDPALSPGPPTDELERTYEPRALLRPLQDGAATPEPPRREITPVYISPPPDGYRDAKPSVEERYGF